MSAYDRRSISVYKGFIGERLAIKYLKKKEFDVVSYMILADFINRPDSLRDTPYYNVAKEFLSSKKEDFSKLLKTLKKLYDGKEHKRRRFDFVAKKDDQYYVVEVKTSGGRLSKFEKRELETAKKMGFTPLLIRTNITLIANLNNVTMQIL
jgi:hypothetical protein